MVDTERGCLKARKLMRRLKSKPEFLMVSFKGCTIGSLRPRDRDTIIRSLVRPHTSVTYDRVERMFNLFPKATTVELFMQNVIAITEWKSMSVLMQRGEDYLNTFTGLADLVRKFNDDYIFS